MVLRRRKLAAAIRLEALEGRVVLSSATHPLHTAVAAHEAQVHATQAHAKAAQASTSSSPVLVNLSPGTTGIAITSVTYDSRIHLITVKGTVDVTPGEVPPYEGDFPSYPTIDYIGVNATQAVNRFQSVSGYEYASAPIADASVTQVPFEGRVLASSGEFQSGIANILITSSDAYGSSYETYSVLARMRNAKAY